MLSSNQTFGRVLPVKIRPSHYESELLKQFYRLRLF
jgi:hypothetical protein